MTRQMTKDNLLENIRIERRQLERYVFYFARDSTGTFVASSVPKLSGEEMVQPGVVDTWSVKDLLAHLVDWEQRFLGWYEAGLQGEIPKTPAPGMSWQDLDRLNQQIFEKHRSRPIDEVLVEFKTSHQQVLATVQAIPEADLFAPDRFAWTEGVPLADFIAANTCDHYRWAKKQIRKWLKTRSTSRRNKDRLLENIQVERRRLEKNLASLSEEEMAQPGVVGEWSVKDLLVHLVDWEQRFLGWYEAGLRGEVPETPAPGLTWGQLNILNRQIFEKHRHRSLDDVLAEFHVSYQQILDTVQTISEEDMFTPGRYAWTEGGTLAGYIAANTGNHYRWAKTQLRKWMKTQAKL